MKLLSLIAVAQGGQELCKRLNNVCEPDRCGCSSSDAQRKEASRPGALAHFWIRVGQDQLRDHPALHTAILENEMLLKHL